MSFVYIGNDIATENNQIALIIIQPIWNSHFFEITVYFRRCHFFDKIWTNNKLMWTCPP